MALSTTGSEIFPELPKEVRSKSLRAEWNAYREACKAEEGLTSPPIAARLLGISQARIHELFKSGGLTPHHYFSKDWVSCREIFDRITNPPLPHRPPSRKEFVKRLFRRTE